MSELYGEYHHLLQHEFDTAKLADRVKELIVVEEMNEEHQQFIENRDMFFLTTVDHRGYPTCSYKGGAPGFVKALDAKTLVFPSYDGNGMFLSLGNINGHNKVGLLFIDFEKPHRIRVHGTANVADAAEAPLSFPGAELIVSVTITEIFVNCPRYVHSYQRIEASKYTPQADFDRPVAPQWKRIDALQDVLPERDRDVAAQHGGTLTAEQYQELLAKGRG